MIAAVQGPLPRAFGRPPTCCPPSMRILVSNDDGIYSPGIAVLAAVAAEFGTVRVVAPHVEQSSMGHAITATRPLSYRVTRLPGFEGYRVNGTPADCVALGAHHWERIDVVLSGVNVGLNLGNAIWHSGTLAAARQAALLGMRGVALSAPAAAEGEIDGLRSWVRKVLEILLPETGLTLVNVNLPREPRGLVWTRVSVRHYEGKIVRMADPLGRPVFWSTVTPVEEAEPGTDRWAVERGWISLNPLRLDLTDEGALDRARAERPLDEAEASSAPPPTRVQAPADDDAPPR